MKSLPLFGLLFTVALGENCDHLGIAVYEDMGCKPTQTSPTSCPTKFDCVGLEVSKDKCYYQGYAYSSEIPKNSKSLSCQFGCFCNIRRNQAEISCAQGGCGDWALPPPKDCYYGYDLNKCCSSETICPPFKDTTKCLVDGKEYRAGERFAPKNSCHVCLCQKGWTGKFEEPFCKRSGCDVQIINQPEVQKSCAPLYVKREGDGESKCCPTSWTCPDGNEKIESGGGKLELTCKFGEKKLKVGDFIKKEITHLYRPLKIRCECKVPPLLICVED